MRVLSNTSPVCNLAVIGRLDLLRERYGEITIPTEVWLELSQLNHPGALAAITCGYEEGWIQIHKLDEHLMLRFHPPLDLGETVAISLANYLKADLLLIDELKGRTAARAHGLKVAGLLGEFSTPKSTG